MNLKRTIQDRAQVETALVETALHRCIISDKLWKFRPQCGLWKHPICWTQMRSGLIFISGLQQVVTLHQGKFGKFLLISLYIVKKLVRNQKWIMSCSLFLVMYYLKKMVKLASWLEMVFCYQNCSDLLWEKIVPVIEKIFEITRTIYSNSERSEQLFVTECFFNLFLEVSVIW